MDTLSLFQNERENRTIAAGEYVFREGDLGAEAFVILEGEVEVEVEGRLIETLGPGDIFGEMAIISSSPRSATVRAKSEVILAVLDERRFQFLVQQTPRFAIHMMRLMADRL
ncbi:MAG TPA: cyclic nucleotide-binding domain-containing protein, partial [Fimbriimonadaceae bacterium]|nr:cyclic nucleotide-binding domain-containing protein [Fimbriimonadaceae bacterium]